MKKKFKYQERKGLPGGPNEISTYLTGVFSIDGYKRNSPDVNNPYNIIPSGNITMKGVDFPVMGTDNLGNMQMMMPGYDYKFPGNAVFEVPMAQGGIEVPKRIGARKNPDGSESTHLMATETLDGKNWFSFPTLFQDPDGTWIDMSDRPWKEAYEEAKRRGEVIEFGTDKEAAIKFGEGSWKLPKAQEGNGETISLSTSDPRYAEYYNRLNDDVVLADPSGKTAGRILLDEVDVVADKATPPAFNFSGYTPPTAVQDQIAKQTPFRYSPEGIAAEKSYQEYQDYIKSLPYDQRPGFVPYEPPTISEYVPPSTGEWLWNKISHPMSTLGYIVRGEDMPDRIGRESAFDYAVDIVNPATYINTVGDVYENLSEGDIVGAGLDAITFVPIVPTAAKQVKKAIPAVKRTTRNIPAKINPKYYNPKTTATGNPDIMYREVGKDAYEDFVNSGFLRTKAEITDNPVMGLLETQKEIKDVLRFNKESKPFQYRHPTDFRAPFFSRGKTTTIKDGGADYLIQTRPDRVGPNNFYSAQWNILHGNQPPVVGGFGIMDPMVRSADNFDVFKKSWWHGYKPIKQLGGSLPTYQTRGEVSFLPPAIRDMYSSGDKYSGPIYNDGMLDEVTVTGDKFKEKWWSPANLATFGLVNKGKRKVTKNVDPMGYGHIIDRVYNALFDSNQIDEWSGTTLSEDKKNHLKSLDFGPAADTGVPTGSTLAERQQLFQYMMGQDASQFDGVPLTGEGYGLRTSAYRPGTESNPNTYYFRSPVTDQNIKQKIDYHTKEIIDAGGNPADLLIPGSGSSIIQPAIGQQADIPTYGSVLGNMTVTKGEDDKGKYISYYDIWDLQPFKDEKADGSMVSIPDNIPLIGGKSISGSKAHAYTEKLQDIAGIKPAEIYNRLYYTENPDGTINFLDEKQGGGEPAKVAAQQATGYRPQATISQYVEPAWYEKAADYLASPMTSLGYLFRGEDLPDRIPINAENRNTYDMAFDIINPAAWVAYAESADKNLKEGNYLAAGFDALGAIPIIPASLSQGKNVIKGGKNVIKNVARSADDVVAGSDDIVKATVKDVKPNARRLDLVEEVNPISQDQAKNLVEQGRNAELFKAFEEGAITIDDFVKSYVADLTSPEGFKRLVQQEADYLRSIGFDEARIASQAEINATARINEIINIGNSNRAIAQGEKSTRSIVNNKYNFNNASYSPNRSSDYFDDLFYKPGMDVDVFNLNKTKIGSKILPGETNLGTMFNNNRAVAAHEIGGHGLQSGRILPVDSRLRNLEPLDEMTEETAKAYKYFVSGSRGKEPSAFLHELRQAMLDARLIRNRYQYISPSDIKRYQTLFDLRPSGTMNTMANKYHSNTRLLDFMKPTESNFNLLARELNNLPAMVPIGIGLGGAAALSEYQEGGEETSWTDYINPMNWGVTNRDGDGDFKQAFRAARNAGEDEFMWYGNRYTTELAPTPEIKEEPKEEKLFYNKDILKGLSEEQVARRQSLLNAANAVAAAQGDNDNLRRLLVMSAVMENTLGADPKAYGRNYTRSPMSIDDVAYDDLFNLREGAKGYTAQQKKNAAWLEGLGINTSDIDSLLRADDPMASMAVARLVYGRAPEALPSGDDPDALYNYYLKYYNKGGVDKYGGAEAHRKKFNDYYNQIYREFGGETDQLKIYKDYVYGVYDGTEMQSKAEKIYDKLNRVYHREAKKQGMRVPNYIMTNVIKQIDN